MKTSYLSIILSEDMRFEDLVKKIESAFNITLYPKNNKGRLIAIGDTGNYNVKLIDRIDDLGDFLCDKNHVLDIIADIDEPLNRLIIENEIKEKLLVGNVQWESGIWTKMQVDKDYRKIFPDNK